MTANPKPCHPSCMYSQNLRPTNCKCICGGETHGTGYLSAMTELDRNRRIIAEKKGMYQEERMLDLKLKVAGIFAAMRNEQPRKQARG